VKYIYHFHAMVRRPLKSVEGVGMLEEVQHHDGLIDSTEPVLTAEAYHKLKDEIAEYANTTRENMILSSLSYMGSKE